MTESELGAKDKGGRAEVKDVAKDISVVIPAYNEGDRIGNVLDSLDKKYQIIVVDDGSDDRTASVARAKGAHVIKNDRNQGYISALKRGLKQAEGEIIVTLDADGEHRVQAIARLVEPIRQGDKDLMLAGREQIPRPSERVLNWLARLKVNVKDTGTGFRAIRKSLADKLDLATACTCGTLVLEANQKGARIGEIEVSTKQVDKPKRIAWFHCKQLFHVLRYLI